MDTRWRLYYNEEWVASHSVEETAAVLIHEVSHLLREHDARSAAAVKHEQLWNTAADCEINDDLLAEGLPLPDNPPTPERFGFSNGENAETYYRQLLKPVADAEPMSRHTQQLPVLTADPARMASRGRGELPDDDGRPGGVPGVDPIKAKLVPREVAHQILDHAAVGDAPLGWKRWARPC